MQSREQKWIVMLADFEAFEAKKTKMVCAALFAQERNN